jgi:hypothetical protein
VFAFKVVAIFSFGVNIRGNQAGDTLNLGRGKLSLK